MGHDSTHGFNCLIFPQGQLNEDKLKCKLRALENQLQACTQVTSD